MISTLRLEDFDVTRSRGFLCGYDASAVTLPALLDPVVAAARQLPHLLPTGRLRSFLDRLPALDLSAFAAGASDEQLRTAMVRYSFLVQAYVWGEPDAPRALPLRSRYRSGSLPNVSDKSRSSPIPPTSSTIGRSSTNRGRSPSTTSA